MGSQQVDAYLDALPEPQQSTVRTVHATLERLLPGAEQVIAYGVPVFKVEGVGVAGVGAYRDHCTYVPMSGAITAELADELAAYSTTKGAVRFPADESLPEALVRRLVEARQAEIARTGR
jgi:uncharacterized protein YdhG (YjbR/CyaY superfamily)